METYKQMQKRHQQEFNDFPKAFAFDKKQLEEGLKHLGVHAVCEVASIGAGGFVRKADAKAYVEMCIRHKKERENLYQMFLYEMWNHEYGYTHDPEDTLESCGFTMRQIKQSKKKLAAWKRAEKRCFEGSIFSDVNSEGLMV